MMKRLLTTGLIAIFAIIGFSQSSAHATDNASKDTKKKQIPAVWLQISPVSNRVTLKKGEALEYNFNVENIGAEDFAYKVYASPYSVSNENYDIDFASNKKRTQLSRWISFVMPDGSTTNNASFNIKAGEKQTVKYRITVPKDIPSGGQYATVLAEVINNESSSASGIKAVSRAGLIIYGNSEGDTKRSADITELGFKSFITGGPLDAKVRVQNTGNTDIEANCSFIVKSLFGKTVFEDKTTYNVLPDTARRISSSWEKTPAIGIFQASYKVIAAGTPQEMTKIVMIIPIFVMIIALLVLTALIIWIIILVRKRQQRKSKLVI